jgi:glutamyl-tRNA reductase
VTNRGAARASRLAELHNATHVDFADLGARLSTVDIVVCATASPAPVLTVDLVRRAIHGRTRPLAILDLAIPRDVEPEVAELPGVHVVDLASLASSTLAKPSTVDRDAADAIVNAEVEAFLTWLRGNDVAPTVAALRARADEVVSSELSRLVQRRPDLSPEQRADVAHALHRVVQRLLHSPTVRVRELAATPGGDQYAALLRELFDLAVPPVPEYGVERAMDIEGGSR